MFITANALVAAVNVWGNTYDNTKIKTVIKNAVENTDWMHAKTQQEVYNILSQYYTGKILMENTKYTWEFIKHPTDFYWTTTVDKYSITYTDKNTALVKAYLTDIKVIDNQKLEGKAVYKLVNTKNGWKICHAEYNWNW